MPKPSFKSFPSFSSFPELETAASRQSGDVTGEPKASRDGERSAQVDNFEQAHRSTSLTRKRERGEERRQTRRESHHRHSATPENPKHLRTRTRDEVDSSPLHREQESASLFVDTSRQIHEETYIKNSSLSGGLSRVDVTFFSDKRGDPLNVRYQRADSKLVPDHRLVKGGTSILGLPSWRVLQRSAKGIELSTSSWVRHKDSGITASHARNLLKMKPARRLLSSQHASQKYEDNGGFIRISSHRAPETITSRHENLDGTSGSGSDSLEDCDSSDDDFDTTTRTSYQEQLVLLEQTIEKKPASCDAWLSLLSHMRSQVPYAMRGAVKARAEITLSLLSRAMPALRGSISAINFRLMYLQAAEEVWPPDQTAREWEEALKMDSPDLRLGWLEWKTRRAGSMDNILEDALRVFTEAKTELERLRIFWRVSVLYKQAGFTERAFAMFQAQAELTFHIPQSLIGLPIQNQLNSLDDFWESEVSRAGENGAQGWATWLETGKPDREAPSNFVMPLYQISSADPYKRWSAEEVASDSTFRPPLRSNDPSADSDPYATIMFDDIKQFLFSINETRTKNAFRLAWLSMLGLRVPGFETLLKQNGPVSSNDAWMELQTLSSQTLDAIFPTLSMPTSVTADSYLGTVVGREEERVNGFGPIRCWSYRVLSPFEGIDLAAGIKWPMWTKECTKSTSVDLARNVFTTCRLGSDDVEWDGLATAFEASINYKPAIKVSRSFLSDAQDSFPRWASHARIERLYEHYDNARKIYRTVLSSPKTLGNRLAAGPLWWDWAEMEWLLGNSTNALDVVLHSSSVSGTSGVQILRAKHTLQQNAQEIPLPLWKLREAWIKLESLLEILTGTSLPLFVTSSIQHSTSPADESSAAASLAMLYHHVVKLRSTARPQLLRERAEQAIEAFPNNTAILGMFLETQKGRGVWGGVDKLLEEVSADNPAREKGVARRLVDVWIAGRDTRRWTWELERTRTALWTGVHCERTRRSMVLWRVYLEFEIRFGELQKAKEVVIQAIADCPLVKDFYVAAFGPLRSVFSASELNVLADTMAELGLRTRRGLDELLDGWQDPDVTGKSAECDGLNEIEHDAHEFDRLKPY